MPAHVRNSFWLTAQRRLFAGLGVAVSLLLVLPGDTDLYVRLLAAWDAFAVVYLALAWMAILRMTPREARTAAEAVDVPHRTSLLLVLMAAIFSFFSSVLVLHRLRQWAPTLETAVSLLGLSAILLSWLLTHTIYGLHYTHLYYGSGHTASGLDFPGDDPPDGMDFQYFAFTIGMTFQVSDVAITHRSLRRVVLRHGMLSFAYATVIIAMTINLIASRL
jgi:uncharacterized membrane protein